MFYPRKILPRLEKELKTKQIIVITGIRQTGKTTILKHLFSTVASSNKALFDLENPLHRKVFEEENYDNVWENLKVYAVSSEEKAYLFIDEIQNLPQISSMVKYLYDHWQVKFFLTGSSSFYFRNLFPESLAGRKLIFELFPLTFAEFLIFKNVEKEFPETFTKKAKLKNRISYERYIKHYQEFMEFGGFPAIVLEKNRERKKELLSEIFKSYFEKDVKNLADFEGISKLRDLILLLIPRIASKFDISKLANELSVSRQTIYNYLSFLEQTYFIGLLSKFSRSLDRQITGGKKVFLCDTGLVNFLGKASLGQLLENSVFQSLRPLHKLNYYKKNSQSEIDFIVDKKIALETKLTGSKRDILTLKTISKNLKVKESYLVCLNFSQDKEVIVATDI